MRQKNYVCRSVCLSYRLDDKLMLSISLMNPKNIILTNSKNMQSVSLENWVWFFYLSPCQTMGRCSFLTVTFFVHHSESGILLHWKAEKVSYRWYKIPKVLNFVSVRTEFYPTSRPLVGRSLRVRTLLVCILGASWKWFLTWVSTALFSIKFVNFNWIYYVKLN